MRACGICGNKRLQTFLSLGVTPLANSFLREDQLGTAEAVHSLDVCFCGTCGLVQLGYAVPREILFRDYIYFSSTSDTIPAHFRRLAEEVTERFLPATDAFVVEVGSNDGCLLKAFPKSRVRTLGVEPASNIARAATAAGVETLNDFFHAATARAICREKGKASAILGNNVLAHVDDLEDFMQGLDSLLADDGVVVVEVPYLVDLLEKIEYDTIYHEHLFYFTVSTLAELFRRSGLKVFDVKRIEVHGGSIRIYGKRASAPSSSSSWEVDRLLALERELRLDRYETYLDFAAKVQRCRESLLALLRKLRGEGKTIIGYGAPAKGNTLLNYCQIGTDLLDYIVDKSPLKQGLYTPGMHIPVFPVERILEDQPDYVLLLAWNFENEILRQESAYRDRGGKFIRPVPTAEII